MSLNKNIVLEIIRTHFSEEVELEVTQSVMELESYELEEIFENSIDYADLDVINEMFIQKLEIFEDEDTGIIQGSIGINVFLDGYVHWEGENEFVDSREITLNNNFEFKSENTEYTDFNMDYVGTIEA